MASDESDAGDVQVQRRGCCSAQVGCCCGGMACRLCCRWCPPIQESTSTRMMYILFLFIGTAIMILMLSPTVEEYLIENFKQFDRICELVQAGTNCKDMTGHQAVYKIGIAFFCLFFLGFVFTLCVRGSRSLRGKLHNGCWLVKLIALCGLCVAAFMIPQDFSQWILPVWFHIGLIGAVLFILIQTLVLANFAQSITDGWHERINNGGSSCFWKSLMFLLGFLLSVIAAVAVVFLCLFYTTLEGCVLNKIFIGVSSVLCLSCICVALQPSLAKRTGSCEAGFMQASVISVDVIYLTWSALSSEPLTSPSYDNVTATPEPLPTPLYQSLIRNLTNEAGCYPSALVHPGPNALLTYVGVIGVFLSVIYSSLGMAAESAHNLGVNIPSPRSVSIWTCCCPSEHTGKPEDVGGQVVYRNEVSGSTYSYSGLHLVFCMATCYLMMHLTNWLRADNEILRRSWMAVWFKIGNCWLCAVVYIMSLVTPWACPGALDRRKRETEEGYMPSTIRRMRNRGKKRRKEREEETPL